MACEGEFTGKWVRKLVKCLKGRQKAALSLTSLNQKQNQTPKSLEGLSLDPLAHHVPEKGPRMEAFKGGSSLSVNGGSRSRWVQENQSRECSRTSTLNHLLGAPQSVKEHPRSPLTPFLWSGHSFTKQTCTDTRQMLSALWSGESETECPAPTPKDF